MSFSGAGGLVESLTLCGVEPEQVERVCVCKGRRALVDLPELEGPAIPAGLTLVDRAHQAGRTGMRIGFGDAPGEAVTTTGVPLVLLAWLSPDRPAGAKLRVVVMYDSRHLATRISRSIGEPLFTEERRRRKRRE